MRGLKLIHVSVGVDFPSIYLSSDNWEAFSGGKSSIIVEARACMCLRLVIRWMFFQPFIQAQIKENFKLRVTGLCAGNSPVTGQIPAQMASNAENVYIEWRHHWHGRRQVCKPLQQLFQGIWAYNHNSLWWRHMGVIMSEVTGNLTIISSACSS